MFDDQSNNSSDDLSAKVPVAATPSFGLGINPNPSFIPPVTNDPTPPPVTPNNQEPTQISTTHASHTSHTVTNSLEEIKIQALSQLSPLVNQLEQTPEEKYKTLMMMIQASDNQDLIGEAYTAAQGISDEKAKAEALLNIVNEINYFTQQHTN